MSQWQNSVASMSPPVAAAQNQPANRPPASTAAPIIPTSGKPRRPRMGLGNPKTEACGDCMTSAQETSVLMSQLVV